MVVARRYLVSGTVQGVGFRFFTEDAARREGLSGFVRNLPDTRVEVLVQGEAEAVARFERAISLGPALARVDDLEIADLPASPATSGFRIRN
jgi:acylphosphatase